MFIIDTISNFAKSVIIKKIYMEYNFNEIEKKWQKYWKKNKTYKTEIDHSKPKHYVLDMFPYPSGAGLHVGHPLGYIASDIYARYKKQRGFNILHPMGYDAFGLPAEQYAIQTGQHPEKTTKKNISRYREQLDRIGFSYDWDRQICTCDPKYYKWTQWTFIKLYKYYFNNVTQKAEPISDLISKFERSGNLDVDAASDPIHEFTAVGWRKADEREKQEILMKYRLAYLSETMVNWCPKLGTVLANDEVKEGYSVRGGYPVVRKKMNQWFLRVTAYAERLLRGLDKIDWQDNLKEIQRNWIGKSEGATIFFKIKDSEHSIEVFTTRPDTVFGATFMVLAPEHELIKEICTEDYKQNVNEYIEQSFKRSERERMAETKSVTGQFTGAYCEHPFTKEAIPIYVADYVLAGYGTGAIMSVPAHDSRDHLFAKKFNIPIKKVVDGPDIEDESYDGTEGTMINSDFINNMDVNTAIKTVTEKLENSNLGKYKVNYRIRDAIFSRQRYWGEPFPVYYKEGIPYVLDEKELPLELPKVDKYLPTESGDPPLARAKNWKTKDGYPLDFNTMPGFAGSSAYYIRYMDPQNDKEPVSKEAVEYWRDVDMYVGGAEHATGHLVYARFWNKFLYDIGVVVEDEPFKKLINQGMIQGRSNFVYRIKGTNKFVSYNLKKNHDTIPVHVDVNIVDSDILDVEAFKKWNPEYKDAEFILEDGKYICGWEVEKMSKSYHNVVNPDDLIDKYGADTLRVYEMFLGPIEQAKPWDTNGLEGAFRFIKRFWRIFHDEKGNLDVSSEKANKEELKLLHKTIKKVNEDIEKFAFNTAISTFMTLLNKLYELNCNKEEVLKPFVVMLSPFAPHISEELWCKLGHSNSVVFAEYPKYDENYIEDDSVVYPVSFNGKMRFKLEVDAGTEQEEIKKLVMEDEKSKKWIEGKDVKKIIVVPGKIVNVVV